MVLYVFIGFIQKNLKESKVVLKEGHQQKDGHSDDTTTVQSKSIDGDFSLYIEALTLSAGLCLLAELVTLYLQKCNILISSLPILSLFSVFGASLFPTTFSKYKSVGNNIASIFLALFFAVTGINGSIREVLRTTPGLFLFSSLQLGVHFVFTYLFGHVLNKIPLAELLVASNANVGGPTTAAAMAKSKKWNSLILPGILLGIIGYSTATFIGIGVGVFFIKGLMK